MVPYLAQANDAGKFVVAGDPILIFERLRALLGFEAIMLAPYTQPDGLHRLLDELSSRVIAVMDCYLSCGHIDAIMTWEDFGLQDRLQMSMTMFREFYKPYYTRIINAAHERGLAYIWHNCGYILEMIPDLIEMGVDVLQLDQARLMGYEQLAAVCGGKIAVWCPLDIQWATSRGVSRNDYADEVRRMVAAFTPYGGGFIARHYTRPLDVGLSKDDELLLYDAFMASGCRLDSPSRHRVEGSAVDALSAA
jgi:uroporphyrinogen-III decarboxylase